MLRCNSCRCYPRGSNGHRARNKTLDLHARSICKRNYRMRRAFASFIGTIIILSLVAPVQADWPEFKHKSGIDFARNNSWPHPFRGADANAVISPFEVMRNNGWREHNTVGTALFSPQQALSEAGQLKIQWIVTQAPENYRVVYVKSGQSPEETSARVESVQLAVSRIIPTGPLPQILVTEIEPTTSSGAYQTLVHRALIKTTPTPRLSKFTGLNAPSQQSVAPNANSGK